MNIEENKEKIIALLEKTNRKGMNDLIKFLLESDFFEAPASTRFHNNFLGGLADHSLKVYSNGWFLAYTHFGNLGIPEESLIIETLLHDLCKVNVYKIDDEEASEAQMRYLTQLVKKAGDFLPVGEIKKQYASNLISWYKERPDEPKPEPELSYKFDDDLPLGHGEKTLAVIQEYIKLEPREMLAIRYHMGSYGAYDERGYQKATEMFPDVSILQFADGLATFSEDWIK